MQSYYDGMSLFMDDDLEGSLSKFNDALALDGSNAEFLVKRATVKLKLKDLHGCLEDCNKALQVDSTHAVALFRKGVACFQLEKFKDSATAFKDAKKAVSSSQQKLAADLDTWMRKCQAELESEEIVLEDSENTTETTNKPMEKLEAKEEKKKLHFSYDWYQSIGHVTIEIKAPGIPKEKVRHEFENQACSVSIEIGSSDETYSYDWDLFGEIDPAGSSIKVLTKKIEIRLKKKNDSMHWPSLERKEGAVGTTVTSTPASSVPSAYASKKNWDALAQEIDQEKPEGDDALNALFKDIYSKANEDTRRAMIKSFQTSGGTVLSTNWNEVKEKNYEQERPAPNGMEWKNWDGDKLNVEKEEDDK